MADLLEIVKTLNDWRFLAALTGVAVVAFAAAAWLRWFMISRRKGAVAVKLRVVDLVKEENGGLTTFKPEFLILTGIYKGQQHLSEVGVNPADHEIGEEVSGVYQPASGVITSNKTTAGVKFIANIALVVGCIATLGALFFALN